MKPKVTLLAYTPNPEQVVAMAAKLCYSPSDIANIREGLDEKSTADFIQMLSNLGHGSPVEHASFTFGIEPALISSCAIASLPIHSSLSAMLTAQNLIL